MKRNLLILAGLIAAGAIIWAMFLRGGADTASTDFTLETAVVERGDVARLVSASGAVRALTTVEVGSQLSGQILELNADFNSEVTAGQIIAKIDPQTFESRVQSARADVASARANLEVQQASIRRAEANLAQIEKNYIRQKSLYEQDAIALSTFEDIERQLEVSRADLVVSKAQSRTSEASLTQRLASLRSAQVDLDRAIIRSPIDGVVIERNVDVGQTVAASFSAPVLFIIAQDLSDIRIDAAVVEADIGGIDEGDTATFKVDAYPDETFRGVVEQVRLASQELQNVVTYTVVIAAENRGGRLLPGMTANVEITAERREGVLRLAENTIRFKPPSDGPTVTNADEASQGGARGGRGGGAGGGAGRLQAMLGDLTIEQDRMDRIGKRMGEEFEKVRAAMGAGGATFDRSRMREMIQSRMDRVLKDELTADEYKQVQKSMAERASQRRVEVYMPNADKTVTKKMLVIGLSDGSNVEILRGAEEGDTFVTRKRQAAE